MRNRNSRRDLGRKRGIASAAAWQPREADADTLRKRALFDARGTVLRTGKTYRTSGDVEWCIRRAVNGRTNQVEITVNGKIWRTCQLRTALKLLS